MARISRITRGAALVAGIAFYGHFAVPQASAEPPSLQRMCDNTSYNAFPVYRRHPQTDVFHSYRDVYNAKLKTCFALLHTTAMSVAHSGEMSIQEELRDVSAGTSYGAMTVSANALQGASVLQNCAMHPAGQPRQTCASEREWSSFVSGYMRKR